LGDVDGDNDLDVVGASSDAIFWFENLDGQARAFETHEVSPVIATKASLHDMDTDGDLDLLAWVSNELLWIENTDANGSFANPRHVLSLADDDRATLDAADLDGDGDPDVIVHSPSDRLLNWYENQNAGSSFVAHDIESGGFPPGDPPSVWDFDLDGDMDVLAGGAIYRNSGRGDFTRVDTITGAQHIVGAVDLDRDGDLDLVTRTNSSLRWQENQAGHFADRQLVVDSLEFRDIAVVAPVDSRDSANVLVVASEESRLYWVDFNTLGDVNYDGVFDSTDLVLVLAAGQYEDDLANNSVIETGDWNNDGEFTSSDLVLAFQAGNYLGAAPQ
jgi:hypothetical protein